MEEAPSKPMENKWRKADFTHWLTVWQPRGKLLFFLFSYMLRAA